MARRSHFPFFMTPGCCNLLFAFFTAAFAQSPPAANWAESGLPGIRNFRPRDYQAASGNHAIAQDSLGLIYAANDAGVLVFDGVQWRLIQLPGGSPAKSLCSANGVIYVGGENDLGYLAPGKRGDMQFVSLRDFIPDSLRNFKGIGETIAIRDTVYFRSYYALFRWDGRWMQAWKPQTLFHTALAAGSTLLVRDWKVGLKRVQGDSFALLPGGEFFIENEVAGIFSHPSGDLLIMTRYSGWFLYNGAGFRSLKTEGDDFMRPSLVFRALQLPDGRYALATHRRGLAIVDSVGRLLQVIDRQAGLRDNVVNFAHRDAQGGLWLALADGLARVETPSPFTYFGEANGLEGNINAMARHRGKLYAATRMGLFVLDSDMGTPARFRKIPGIESAAYSLLSLPERLLVGGHRGLFEVPPRRDNATLLSLGTATTVMLVSLKHPGRIYLGTYTDLEVLEFFPGQPLLIHPLKGFSDYVLSIVEERDGSLWIGARKGLYRLTPPVAPLNPQMKSTLQVVHFDSTAGMPENPVKVASISGRMHFITQMGLRRYLPQQRRFISDSSFGAAFAEPNCVLTHLIEDRRGKVWLAGQIDGTPFCHPADFPQEGIPAFRLEEIGALLAIYPDEDGVIWLGGTDGMLRYDPAVAEEPHAPFYALIREVETGDSLIFAGAIDPDAPRAVPTLPYSGNSLRFRFAATDYRSPASLRYRHQLEGFDRGWSAWSAETFRDYTGLPPGEYLFRVQAQNGHGALSREASFAYRILPSWYRTAWAYLFYGLLMVALVAGIVKWRVWQLQQEARRLEALIAERTRTIQQQSDKLAELDHIKSRFFANISHEFRTPLTLILGPLEDWLAQAKDLTRKAEWLRMRRAARRLLRLINQLLDLSRLEAGQLTLRAAPGDFPAFLKGVTMSFASLAEQKQIQLHFNSDHAADELREMYFDHDKMETIISNLLANALKFTPKDGEVRVSVHSILSGKVEGGVEVKISDSGPGIPADQRAHIFERFYQGDDRTTSAHSGVGIGLALVKELVELHHGEVFVESAEGRGTTFVLRLPAGREAFRAEELREEMPDKSIEPAWEDEMSEEAVPMVSAHEKSVVRGEKPVILLVEDHADVRRYISGQLRESFEIVEAEEGESGWRTALEIVPDLVVSDVMMPGIDGGKLCEKLKGDPRTSHIPVVLLTARAGEEDRLAGLEIGADDYLTKPFNSRELQIRVRNLIEQRRKLREIYRREGLLQTAAPPMPSTEQAFIRRLMSVVDAAIAEENFGPEEMSRALNMSRRQMQRKIHALTGQSPAEFIRTVRLRHARQLLSQHAGTVSEIAFRVGFNNLSYFARSFKKEFGVNPSQFLQSSGITDRSLRV